MNENPLGALLEISEQILVLRPREAHANEW